MAITKIGAPLSGIRGTIGGITYSANGSGPYAKLWAQPPHKNTVKQAVQRSYQSEMPALWNAMTDVQRAAWRTFAADPAQELTNSLGEAYYASGFNWFTKCNVRLLRMGLATIVPVPTQARPAAPTINDFRVCVAGTESDLCTCGVASASTENPGREAAKAFDDILLAANSWVSLNGNTTGWLRYDLCDPANVKRYRIYPRPGSETMSPADWTFQVFSGGGWQTIHTVTGEAGWAAQWYDFYCPNTYTETDYRINITQNQGAANNVSICEMEYYLADEGSSVIIYPEDEFDDAPDWDLVLQIAMSNTPKLLWQYPGFYEIKLNSAPGRWYQTFQADLLSTFGTVMDQRAWFAQLFRQTAEGLRSAPATERTETIGG